MAKKDTIVEQELKNLGERIKALRISKGFTSHEDFAHECGISRSQYWRYEKGQDMRFSTLVKLLKAFGVSLEEFFSEGFNTNKGSK